jgi:hypothetical protein
MSKTFQNLILLLGALLIMTTAPAFAQRAPDWMVGTFEGHNQKYRQDMTVRMNRDGKLIVTNLKNGERVARNTATYNRGSLTIDGKDYRVEQTNNGFRLIQRDDPSNTVDFRRTGDYDENWQRDPITGRDYTGRDTGRLGDSNPPNWMVGQFEGYDQRFRRNVAINMSSDGRFDVANQSNGQTTGRNTASYNRGIFTINNKDYDVERSGSGFRLIERADRSHRIDFRRTGDYDENWQRDPITGRDTGRFGDTRPPDWMVGTFEGYNRKYRQDMTVRMNNNGKLIVTNLVNGERVARNTATYNRGSLIIDGKDYRVEQTNNGFRLIQRDDRSNTVDFRRTGDYNENWQNDRNNGRYGDSNPPDWMVGTFEGYDRKDRQNITFRMNSNGRLSATNGKNGERIGRKTVSYHRGILTLDDRDYDVEETNSGFRLIDRDDRGHRIDFRRTGDY